jgi:hypothetical protein
MKPDPRALRFLPAALLALCSVVPVAAQTPNAAENEPNVKRTVVEDDGVRIEELRVRGQTQRIVVRSKTGNVAPYEIVPIDGARDIPQNRANARGAEGKRVWSLFSF